MDFVTVSTGLISPYWMGLPIRYIHVKSGEAQKWVELYRDRIQNSLDSKQIQFSIQTDNSTYPPSIYKIQNGIIAYVMNQNAWFVNGKKINLIANVNDNKFDLIIVCSKILIFNIIIAPKIHFNKIIFSIIKQDLLG